MNDGGVTAVQLGPHSFIIAQFTCLNWLMMAVLSGCRTWSVQDAGSRELGVTIINKNTWKKMQIYFPIKSYKSRHPLEHHTQLHAPPSPVFVLLILTWNLRMAVLLHPFRRAEFDSRRNRREQQQHCCVCDFLFCSSPIKSNTNAAQFEYTNHGKIR